MSATPPASHPRRTRGQCAAGGRVDGDRCGGLSGEAVGAPLYRALPARVKRELPAAGCSDA